MHSALLHELITTFKVNNTRSLWVWFEIVWQHKILSLLCFKERIGQSNNADPFHSWIIAEIWINVEENWHIHLSQ